jgi:hypothetical protein
MAKREAFKSSTVPCVMQSAEYKHNSKLIKAERHRLDQAKYQGRILGTIQSLGHDLRVSNEQAAASAEQAAALASHLAVLRGVLHSSQLSALADVASSEQQRLQAEKDCLTASDNFAGQLAETQAELQAATSEYERLKLALERSQSQIEELRGHAAAASQPFVISKPSLLHHLPTVCTTIPLHSHTTSLIHLHPKPQASISPQRVQPFLDIVDSSLLLDADKTSQLQALFNLGTPPPFKVPSKGICRTQRQTWLHSSPRRMTQSPARGDTEVSPRSFLLTSECPPHCCAGDVPPAIIACFTGVQDWSYDVQSGHFNGIPDWEVVRAALQRAMQSPPQPSPPPVCLTLPIPIPCTLFW